MASPAHRLLSTKEAYDLPPQVVHDLYQESRNPKTAEKFSTAVKAGERADQAVRDLEQVNRDVQAARQRRTVLAEETVNAMVFCAAGKPGEGLEHSRLILQNFQKLDQAEQTIEQRTREGNIAVRETAQLIIAHRRAAGDYDAAARTTDRTRAAGDLARKALQQTGGVIGGALGAAGGAVAGGAAGAAAAGFGAVIGAPLGAAAGGAAGAAAGQRAFTVERGRPYPPPNHNVLYNSDYHERLDQASQRAKSNKD